MAGFKRKSFPRRINENRAYLLVALMLVLGIFAKNFFTLYNMKSILDSTILYSLIGIGFTICMIAGHMDLSVGYMANLGAVLVMGIHTLQKMPWTVALPVALIAGTLFGTLNGLLISKGKIHSFIVTLGMQFVLKGIMSIYCNGAEIGDKGDYAFADFLNKFLQPLPLTPKVIVALTVVIGLAVILNNTRFGRNVYIVGGNLETAWLGGVNSTMTTVTVFAISGFVSALGGALFAIAQSSAAPNMGEKGIAPLMVALAATIIGGTSTDGGRGSVWKTFIAVLGLMAMFNVLTALVGKYEIQILSNGVVLASVVLYETITNYFAKRKVGIRAQLVVERERMLSEAKQ